MQVVVLNIQLKLFFLFASLRDSVNLQDSLSYGLHVEKRRLSVQLFIKQRNCSHLMTCVFKLDAALASASCLSSSNNCGLSRTPRNQTHGAIDIS
jgi:hypothetical protein